MLCHPGQHLMKDNGKKMIKGNIALRFAQSRAITAQEQQYVPIKKSNAQTTMTMCTMTALEMKFVYQ